MHVLSHRLPAPRLPRRGAPQLLAFAAILLVDWLVSPQFFDLRMQGGRLFGSLIDVFNRGAPVALLSIGMVLVVATRGIDLSVGAVMAIAGAVAATLADSHALPVVLAASLGAGILCGAWNGFLVAVLGIQPIIATLILMVAGRGIAQLLTEGRIVTFSAPGLAAFSNGAVFGLPAPIVLTFGVLAVTVLVVRGTALGLLIEATGANARASALAGVSTRTTTLSVYVWSGFCAGSPASSPPPTSWGGCQQCRPVARARRDPGGGDRRDLAARWSFQRAARGARRLHHPGDEHRHPALGPALGTEPSRQGGGGARGAPRPVAPARRPVPAGPPEPS